MNKLLLFLKGLGGRARWMGLGWKVAITLAWMDFKQKTQPQRHRMETKLRDHPFGVLATLAFTVFLVAMVLDQMTGSMTPRYVAAVSLAVALIFWAIDRRVLSQLILGSIEAIYLPFAAVFGYVGGIVASWIRGSRGPGVGYIVSCTLLALFFFFLVALGVGRSSYIYFLDGRFQLQGIFLLVAILFCVGIIYGIYRSVRDGINPLP